MHTPTYRIEFNGETNLTNQAWRRDYGRPTDANLTAFVAALEESTMPGGANEHLERLSILTARIVRQATGEVVALYHASLFEVIEAA